MQDFRGRSLGEGTARYWMRGGELWCILVSHLSSVHFLCHIHHFSSTHIDHESWISVLLLEPTHGGQLYPTSMVITAKSNNHQQIASFFFLFFPFILFSLLFSSLIKLTNGTHLYPQDSASTFPRSTPQPSSLPRKRSSPSSRPCASSRLILGATSMRPTYTSRTLATRSGATNISAWSKLREELIPTTSCGAVLVSGMRGGRRWMMGGYVMFN